MSRLKIFLSSTCYDLAVHRDELSKFFESLGHESILSDNGDICYDPREHTYESCMSSVKECDMLVLLIGKRFGSGAIPKVTDKLDLEYLASISNKSESVKNIKNTSITQIEVFTAIESNIPIYVLVDKGVHNDFFLYKNNDCNINISYSHIDKNEDAKYIFDFIEYISNKNKNNAIETYSKIDDIRKYLATQWSQYFQKLLKEQYSEKIETNKNEEKKCIDDIRNFILNTYKPNSYTPLKYNFCDITTSKNCETSVYPNLFVLGDHVEKINFDEHGYRFNGKNMISMHFQKDLPCETEERSFVLALRPTQLPVGKNPMFFFSYGQRISHDCDDGKYNNHDKSFGLYFGEPAPEEENDSIPEEYKGTGLRIFFYCEKCKKDRNSVNCDTTVIHDMKQINQWYILALTYDSQKNLKLYLNSKLIFNEEYTLKTSQTPYLNLGGFVHHNEECTMVIQDLYYTMKGYIREFMIFKDKALSEGEIIELSEKVEKLIE